MRRKRQQGSFWLDFFACFFIPAYTLLFAGSVEWFGTNFSVLAVAGQDHYRGFFLWGVLAGGYFLVMLLHIGLTLPRRQDRLVVWGLTVAGVACLGYALVIPYLPDDSPKYAQLHVLLAFAACVLLMAALLWVILYARRVDGVAYAPLLWAWGGIAAGCGVLFLLAGMVSSALEVFFTISATLLTRKLWLWRKRR